jgi:hypothetical protein
MDGASRKAQTEMRKQKGANGKAQTKGAIQVFTNAKGTNERRHSNIFSIQGRQQKAPTKGTIQVFSRFKRRHSMNLLIALLVKNAF